MGTNYFVIQVHFCSVVGQLVIKSFTDTNGYSYTYDSSIDQDPIVAVAIFKPDITMKVEDGDWEPFEGRTDGDG